MKWRKVLSCPAEVEGLDIGGTEPLGPGIWTPANENGKLHQQTYSELLQHGLERM